MKRFEDRPSGLDRALIGQRRDDQAGSEINQVDLASCAGAVVVTMGVQVGMARGDPADRFRSVFRTGKPPLQTGPDCQYRRGFRFDVASTDTA